MGPLAVVNFPTTAKSLPPVPELSDLSVEERDAWTWMTSAGKFDAQLVNLTPRLARLLLTRVGDNRKPKRATIQRYAQVMESGQWMLTHQGIGISTRFEVVDGQHRIHAVLESDVTIEVLVVRGVEQDAILVLDSGTVRTDADSIRISDIALKDLERYETATARRMIRGVRRFMRQPSRADLRLFILAHRAAIQLSKEALWQCNKVPNVTHNEMIAVMARASYHCPRGILLEACAFLASGKGTADSDRIEPLRLLREWLIKGRDLKARYGKAERAMRAFVDGEAVGKRLTEAREELFPIMGDPSWQD